MTNPAIGPAVEASSVINYFIPNSTGIRCFSLFFFVRQYLVCYRDTALHTQFALNRDSS